MSKMKISTDIIEQIKAFEGFRLEAYRDVAGVPTIGIGHTGEDVVMGDKISVDEANRLFRKDVEYFENIVNRLNEKMLVKTNGYGGLTQRQFDALVSLVYNTGGASIGQTSTFYKILMNGGRCNYPQICHAFMLWVKTRNPNTGKLEVCGGRDGKHGLVRRRAIEAAWYVYGVNWEQEFLSHGIKDVVEWARG